MYKIQCKDELVSIHPSNGREYNSPRQENRLVDPDEVRRTLRLLVEQGQVVELRALNAITKQSPRYRDTASGYFNDPEAMVQAVCTIISAKGIYITLNPCRRGLITRANNRLRTSDDMRLDSRTTQDTEILKYRWLPIDIDPVRQDGNDSSSDAEHEAALFLALHIRNQLHTEGWGWPIMADSGNGAHLLYLLPKGEIAQAEGFIKRALAQFASRFNTAEAKIDTGVFNPARIWKLYGTMACKGDPTPEWPHRMSRILEEGGARQ